MDTTSVNQILNVIIVEDEALYRDMLRLSLNRDSGIRVIATYAEPHAVLADDVARSAHAAILDIELSSDMNGFELGLRLRRECPQLGIVLLSNFREPAFIAALMRRKMNGWAYLLKKSVADVATLSRAIKGAAEGLIVLDPDFTQSRGQRRPSIMEELTPRQRDILALVAQGYSNQAIADQLRLSVKSVENHMNEILSRLNVNSRDPHVHPRVAAVLRYLYETQLPHSLRDLGAST